MKIKNTHDWNNDKPYETLDGRLFFYTPMFDFCGWGVVGKCFTKENPKSDLNLELLLLAYDDLFLPCFT